MQEKTSLKGSYEIQILDTISGEKRIIKLDNQLTKLYRKSVISALAGTASNIQIKYIGFGTGSTQASENDTRLESEITDGRKAPTVAAEHEDCFESVFVLMPADLAGQTIKEIGIFAGTSATTAINTGTMISRLNVDIEKTSSQQIIFVRKDYVNI